MDSNLVYWLLITMTEIGRFLVETVIMMMIMSSFIFII